MTEGTYYLASGILGLVGLVVLSWYAWLTRRISLAAFEQSEAPQKPCIVLVQVHDMTALPGGVTAPLGAYGSRATVHLKNIGSGPALNGTYRLQSLATPDEKTAVGELPPIPPGEEWDTSYPLAVLGPKEEFVCEYESLSRRRYRTSEVIENAMHIVAVRFERLSRS